MTPVHFAVAAIVVIYPAVVYFGLDLFEARFVAAGIIVIAAVRLLLAGRVEGIAAYRSRINLILGGLLIAGALSALSNTAVALQYYPVCVNGLLLVVFAVSLVRPPSIAERIARLKTPTLPAAAISYTRKVTMVWCGFFAINGSIALYTVLIADLGLWAVYNSLISYVLMGLLFAGEYLVRRNVLRAAAGHDGVKGCL